MSKAKKLIDGDYVLEDGCAWFEVENISIRIHKTDEGVVVDLYPKGREDEDAVASTYMYFSEADDSLSEEEYRQIMLDRAIEDLKSGNF